MAFIGNYMRGASGDTGMPGIIGLQQYIQQGFDAGRAQGQNQQLAQLSQSAFNDTGNQQQRDVSQAIGIDPRFGYSLAGQVGAQSATQRQQAQFAKFGKIASAIVAAKQRGDDAAAEGIYQAARPELQAEFPDRPAPPTLDSDPSIWGNLEKVAVMYGQGLPAPDKGVVISAGGQLVNPTTGATMANVPSAPKIVIGGDGRQYAVSPGQNGSLVASPISIGGTPPQQPQPMPRPGLSTSVPGTNGQNVTFDFPPGTPPQVIAAARASAVANGDIAPGAQVGTTSQPTQAPQRQFLTAKPTGDGSFVTMTPSQLKAANLPPDTVAQVGPNGEIHVIQKGAAGFQGGEVLMPGDPTKTGAEYMATLDPAVRTIVAGLLDGTKPWPSGTVLKNPLWAQAVVAAQQADPGFNAATYQQRAKARNAFTNGKQGDMLRQLRTISMHADQYTHDVMDLNNGNFTPFNFARNTAASAFGAKAPGNVNTDALAVSEEVSKFLTGGVPAVTTIDEWKDALGTNASRDQQISRVTRVIGVVGGQLASLVQQYKSAMGPVSQPLAVVNPQAAEAFKSLVDTAQRFHIALPPHVAELQSELTVPVNARNPVNGVPVQQAPPAAPSGVDSLLSKYGVQ